MSLPRCGCARPAAAACARGRRCRRRVRRGPRRRSRSCPARAPSRSSSRRGRTACASPRRQDVVRGLDFLNFASASSSPGLRSGVVLARELAVRLLDLLRRGVLATPSVSYNVLIPRRSPVRVAGPCRRAGSPSAAPARRAGLDVLGRCASSASWMWGSNFPFVSISFRPSRCNASASARCTSRTPSSSFASSCCSAASSARSRSSSTGSSSFTRRSAARVTMSLCSRAARSGVVELGLQTLERVEVVVALARDVRERIGLRRCFRRSLLHQFVGQLRLVAHDFPHLPLRRSPRSRRPRRPRRRRTRRCHRRYADACACAVACETRISASFCEASCSASVFCRISFTSDESSTPRAP